MQRLRSLVSLSWSNVDVPLAAVVVFLLLRLPLQPGGIPRPKHANGICLDVAVMIAVLVALRAASAARGRPLSLRPVRWWGSRLSFGFGALWTLLFTFECGRAATLHATNNELPLYDSLLLAHHLYILGRDLYGWQATALLAFLFVSPLLVWLAASPLFGRIEAATLRIGPVAAPLTAIVLLVSSVASNQLDSGTRFVTPVAIDNAQRSVALWRDTWREVARGPSPEIVSAKLAQTPDVAFYIAESYGEIAMSDPNMRAAWEPAMKGFEARLQQAGMHVVSGLTDAPVHGGRSWIADASLLMGLTIEHESTYEHMMTLTDSLPHLPGFFAERGYETVLVKPKDRERPGVRLENPFAFERTVFAADLDYRGPFYGWGEIPDQFTIERVEEEILSPAQRPVFAFFHLVSSHMPWTESPPLQDGWRAWQSVAGPRKAVFAERSFDRELAMRFSRWKRVLRDDRPEKEPTTEQPARYIENVVYDIESVVRLLERGLARPRIVVLMGDHQPPLVAQGSGFEAVVHVISPDPAWLEAWRDRGFQPGMIPPEKPATVSHRDLFPTLVRSLSAP